MLNKADIETAVRESIITREQATKLFDLSLKDNILDDNQPIDFTQTTRDEPFRLMKGFRDFFIAIGLAIFLVGITTALPKLILGQSIADIFENGPSFGLIILILLWMAIGFALSEWITKKQRLPFSSIILTIATGIWFAVLVFSFISFSVPVQELGNEFVSSFAFAGAFIGISLFYWRYRLPFALLPIAGTIVGVLIGLTLGFFPSLQEANNVRFVTGVLGIATFIAAMSFDIQDPERKTRLSECAFWLHLLAAPLIIHSLLVDSIKTPDTLFIAAVIIFFGIIALIIDRRAMLVSSLLYVTASIIHFIKGSSWAEGNEFGSTTLFLGVIFLALGLGWPTIRRVIFNLVPNNKFKAYLPPAN